MLRLISLLAALSLSAPAFPQAAANPAIQQVRLLAPQLLAFAGSAVNFESLVNGLTQGTPVTLTTVSADGSVQIVTFVPGTILTSSDAARILETARQALISRGIATPSAPQLAISLLGGALPTAPGTTPVTGVLSGNAGATPVPVRNETVDGNATFAAPGRAMTAFEISQALQLASLLPAQQVRNTSDSPRFGTSNSQVLGTSNTPPAVSAPTTGALVVPGATGATTGGTAASPRIGTAVRSR